MKDRGIIIGLILIIVIIIAIPIFYFILKKDDRNTVGNQVITIEVNFVDAGNNSLIIPLANSTQISNLDELEINDNFQFISGNGNISLINTIYGRGLKIETSSTKIQLKSNGRDIIQIRPSLMKGDPYWYFYNGCNKNITFSYEMRSGITHRARSVNNTIDVYHIENGCLSPGWNVIELKVSGSGS